MDIFGVLSLVGGLAMFLFGMNAMGQGLEKLSGSKLEIILGKLTSNPVKSVLLGALVTAVIQSSSATTVMVVGFVNSGIMKLKQAVGVIMGANIGTTMTSWLLTLTGIEGDNFFIQMLKPSSFTPILAIIGVFMTMMTKTNRKKRDIGTILVGFAVLMFGMEAMSDAVKPLADNEAFRNILTMFTNPILGVLAGAILTAIIQSSSASVGILQAVCSTGAVSFSAAVPIIMGQNIGTCVTALLSSVGANKNARRAALVHLNFNIIGTTVFMLLFYGINAIQPFPFFNEAASETHIAIVHSVFNIFATLLLLPFSNQLVKLACFAIRDKREDEAKEEQFELLDSRFLSTPAVALEQCKAVSVKMAECCRDTMKLAISLLGNYNEKDAEIIVDNENRVDDYEDKLGSYLLQLGSKDLTVNDSQAVNMLLHCINDFERISDHAVNIMESAREMSEKGLTFSKKAMEEIHIFNDALTEILDKAMVAFEHNDVELAKSVEPLEEVIDNIRTEIRNRHIKRLRKGKCTIEMGFVFTDLITNYERVSDHCSNIAVCMIQIHDNSFDTHGYLSDLKKANNKEFSEKFAEFSRKYALPEKEK